MPIATSADAACSPGVVASCAPRNRRFRHVRSPQTAGRPAIRRRASPRAAAIAGAAWLPSSRSSHAARVRADGSAEARPAAAAVASFCGVESRAAQRRSARASLPHHRRLRVRTGIRDSDCGFGFGFGRGFGRGLDADGDRALSPPESRRCADAALRRTAASSSFNASSQRVERALVADLAERVEHAPADVGALVLRRGDQRVDGAAVADLAERGRGAKRGS